MNGLAPSAHLNESGSFSQTPRHVQHIKLDIEIRSLTLTGKWSKKKNQGCSLIILDQEEINYLYVTPAPRCSQSLHGLDHNHNSWKKIIQMRFNQQSTVKSFNEKVSTCTVTAHLYPKQIDRFHEKNTFVDISLVR